MGMSCLTLRQILASVQCIAAMNWPLKKAQILKMFFFVAKT